MRRKRQAARYPETLYGKLLDDIEVEILKYLAHGYYMPEINNKLGLTKYQGKWHIKKI